MSQFLGVDGCPAGWIAVVWNGQNSGPLALHCAPTLVELIEQLPQFEVMAIDIPIGLLSVAAPGGRGCDRAARTILGRPRGSSVFSPPVRAALDYPDDYAAALRKNRLSSRAGVGISKQCFHIMPKISRGGCLPHAAAPGPNSGGPP